MATILQIGAAYIRVSTDDQTELITGCTASSD